MVRKKSTTLIEKKNASQNAHKIGITNFISQLHQ